jgi:hypothetical protein
VCFIQEESQAGDEGFLFVFKSGAGNFFFGCTYGGSIHIIVSVWPRRIHRMRSYVSYGMAIHTEKIIWPAAHTYSLTGDNKASNAAFQSDQVEIKYFETGMNST